MFEEAAYQQALALKAAGDTQGAAEVLAELPDSDRAQGRADRHPAGSWRRTGGGG